MPYSPGVQDISGQIRAQGMMQGSGILSKGVNSIVQDWTKRQEEDKQAMAAVKGTAQFLKTNANLLGVDPATVDELITQKPNENALQWHNRMGAFMTMAIQKPVIQKAQQEIERSKAETDVARMQFGQLQTEAEQQAKTLRLLSNPEIQKVLGEDPEKASSMLLTGGANPRIVEQFLGPSIKRRVDERTNAEKMDNTLTIAALRAELAGQNANKPPSGFERLSDGSLRPIKGSQQELEYNKTQQEMDLAKKKDLANQQAIKRQEEMFIADVDQTLMNIAKAKELVRAGAGGKIDSLAAKVGLAPKTDELDSLYATINSANLINKLIELKKSSPSGASGLASLSDKEGSALASSIAELNTGRPENFQLERLNTLEKYLLKAKGAKPQTINVGASNSPTSSGPVRSGRFVIEQLGN